jgi:hypothetical protein
MTVGGSNSGNVTKASNSGLPRQLVVASQRATATPMGNKSAAVKNASNKEVRAAGQSIKG